MFGSVKYKGYIYSLNATGKAIPGKLMNETLLDLMGRHFLLHESALEMINQDRETCVKLDQVKTIAEWNETIGSLNNLDLRSEIEASGIINQILP